MEFQLNISRYRHGYCKSNPRKMVAVWAEKEMRNLARMHEVGLPVPKPHLLKGHVLVMDFLGKDGWPAPLLKNANLSQEVWINEKKRKKNKVIKHLIFLF